jgi:hypothetical protein
MNYTCLYNALHVRSGNPQRKNYAILTFRISGKLRGLGGLFRLPDENEKTILNNWPTGICVVLRQCSLVEAVFQTTFTSRFVVKAIKLYHVFLGGHVNYSLVLSE